MALYHCSLLPQEPVLLPLSRFSRVWLCATPQTTAHQAPPSLGFSRQEHWSGLPFPSPVHESEKWKWNCSIVSDSLRPHGLQPTRLLHPWDSPGKSTGVGRHCLLHPRTHNSHLIMKKISNKPKLRGILNSTECTITPENCQGHQKQRLWKTATAQRSQKGYEAKSNEVMNRIVDRKRRLGKN